MIQPSKIIAKKNYQLFQLRGIRYVITDSAERYKSVYNASNFMNTRKALAGILNDDETLEQLTLKCQLQCEKRKYYV